MDHAALANFPGICKIHLESLWNVFFIIDISGSVLFWYKILFKEEAVEPMTPAIPACLASLLHSGIWSSFSFLATSKPPFSCHAEGFRHQEHSSTDITVYGAISKCFTQCLWWIFIYKRLHSAGLLLLKISQHTRASLRDSGLEASII